MEYQDYNENNQNIDGEAMDQGAYDDSQAIPLDDETEPIEELVSDPNTDYEVLRFIGKLCHNC